MNVRIWYLNWHNPEEPADEKDSASDFKLQCMTSDGENISTVSKELYTQVAEVTVTHLTEELIWIAFQKEVVPTDDQFADEVGEEHVDAAKTEFENARKTARSFKNRSMTTGDIIEMGSNRRVALGIGFTDIQWGETLDL